MKARTVAADPLRVFRLFTGLQFVLLFLVALAFLSGRHHAGYHSPAQLLVMVAGTGALFGFFLWRTAERRLGRGYLPAAIALSTAVPLAGQVILVWEGHPFAEYAGVRGEMALFALLPVLLASWGYGFRWVAALTTTICAVDVALTRAAYPLQAHSVGYGRESVTRLAGYLATGYLVTRLLRELRARSDALHRANTNLAHYAATLEHLSVARERERLARELHDTLAHSLSGLAVRLEAVDAVWDHDPGQARTLLTGALSTARDGLAETRRALRDLRAAPLEELGLRGALDRCAHAAARRCGAALELALADPLPDLPPRVEQCLYRVAQEALENVVRHAGAGRVTLSLTGAPDGLTLSVTDDGRGFDPDGAHGNAGPDRPDRPDRRDRPDRSDRLGLLGLAERARLAGAVLRVVSRPGAGTTVTLRFPEHLPGRPALGEEPAPGDDPWRGRVPGADQDPAL